MDALAWGLSPGGVLPASSHRLPGALLTSGRTLSQTIGSSGLCTVPFQVSGLECLAGPGSSWPLGRQRQNSPWSEERPGQRVQGKRGVWSPETVSLLTELLAPAPLLQAAEVSIPKLLVILFFNEGRFY